MCINGFKLITGWNCFSFRLYLVRNRNLSEFNIGLAQMGGEGIVQLAEIWNLGRDNK